MDIKVAVYGTLRKDFWNHQRISKQNHNYLGKCTLSLENHIMTDSGRIPVLRAYTLNDQCCVAAKNIALVDVEVYEIENLDPLDQLEGYPYGYNRKLVPTTFGDAWIYFMDANEEARSQRRRFG